jgi:hypothetical protein
MELFLTAALGLLALRKIPTLQIGASGQMIVIETSDLKLENCGSQSFWSCSMLAASISDEEPRKLVGPHCQVLSLRPT